MKFSPYSKTNGMKDRQMDNIAFKTILIGDNGTAEAERAVDVAISLAGSLKAKLIVLGVVTPPSAESQAEGYGLDSGVKAKKMLEAKFSQFQKLGQRDGISIVTEIVEGDPEEMIERRAEAEDVDLIIVGHRDVTRVRRWLEGSTSESLVKKSKTSVLVVRDGDEA
jgi:Universal stress protein UspA and related nucleotide-binding proteins